MPLTHIKNSSITPSNEFNLSLKIERNCLTLSTGNSENIFVTYFLQSPLSLFLVFGLLMNLCS